MMRFDRFTERAQEAAQRAAEIIQRYGHNQIDTEHILLALIEQPQGVITQLLEILKINTENFKERLDYILRTNPKANIFGKTLWLPVGSARRTRKSMLILDRV